MKKILFVLTALVLSVALLASCSKDTPETPKDLTDPTLNISDCIEVPYQYDLTPYITVEKADYTGLEITKIDTTVTDEDLNAAIHAALEEAATFADVTDRGAKEGDNLVIDFKGSVDGEYFDGGEATDYEMVLGEAGFIEGFEDAIVGHKAGEEFVIDVTFPENYNEELGGKAAKFEIKIKSIKETVLPELNEEFVLNNTECKSVEEFVTYITEEAALLNIENAKAEKRNEAFAQIVANVELADYPEDEYKFYYDDYVNYYESMAQTYYGVDLKTFITEVAGSTEEEFYYYADVNASQIVEQELIVFAIANAENLISGLTKGDYDAYLVELGEYYEMDAASVESQYGATEIWKSLIMEKVMDYVIDNAVEVEPKAEETTDPEVTVIEGVKVEE